MHIFSIGGIVAVVLLVNGVGFAAAAKQIDLRNQTDGSGNEYDVAFCARPTPKVGVPGHMFVSYSSLRANGERTFVAVGATTAPDVGLVAAIASYFGGPVSGMLKQEMYTAIKEQCLDLQVNESDYNAAFALTADPLTALGITPPDSDVVLQEYQLGAEDCMTFAIGVAKLLESKGLLVPERQTGELPMAYVQRLIDAN